MATIELNLRELRNNLKKDFKLDFVVDRLEMLGISVENVNKNILTVEVFPNRPDFLSQYGIIKALKSFTGIERGISNYKVHSSNYIVKVDKNLSRIRPFTACCVVKDIKMSGEKIRDLIQFQEKLHVTICRNRRKAAIGIYPLEKIAFPVHFKAMAQEKVKFQPLDHGSEITGNELLSLTEQGKKYGHLIKSHNEFPVFVDSENNILSVPPIVNSENQGKVTENTHSLFIEVSGFNFEFLKNVLNIIVASLSEMGGKIYSVEVKYSSKSYKLPDLTLKKFKFDSSYINKILGLNLTNLQIKNLAGRMGLSVESNQILIPSYRNDILHQIDIVEEIAIAYGYENFKPLLESFFYIGQERKFENFKDKIKEILIGQGFIEVSSQHISNKTKLNEMMNMNSSLRLLRNSINQDYNVLRNWLSPGLIEILSNNKHNEYPQKLFEVGTVFNKDEITNVAVLISHSKANFTDIKKVTESIFYTLKINHNELSEMDLPYYIQGRSAEILIHRKHIGTMGEINPIILENWNIEMPISILEIDLESVFNVI